MIDRFHHRKKARIDVFSHPTGAVSFFLLSRYLVNEEAKQKPEHSNDFASVCS